MLPTDGRLDETIAGEQWRWTDRALFTRQMDMYTHPQPYTPPSPHLKLQPPHSKGFIF